MLKSNFRSLILDKKHCDHKMQRDVENKLLLPPFFIADSENKKPFCQIRRHLSYYRHHKPHIVSSPSTEKCNHVPYPYPDRIYATGCFDSTLIRY